MWELWDLFPKPLTSLPLNHLSLASSGVPPPPLLPNAATRSLYFLAMASAPKSPLSPRTFSTLLAPSKVRLNHLCFVAIESKKKKKPWNYCFFFPNLVRYFDSNPNVNPYVNWNHLLLIWAFKIATFVPVSPSNCAESLVCAGQFSLPVIFMFGIW